MMRSIVAFGALAAVMVSILVAVAPAETASVQSVEAVSADASDVKLREELVALDDAWALGGGTYGFPFWEKAGQRWHGGQITATMYREYVDGYRDRLRAGCELIDAIDTKQAASRDVRSLVLDACHARVDALKSQHRWLNAVIDQDYRNPGDLQDSLQQQEGEHEAAYRAALQDSYRDARLALNIALAALDDAGLDRLSEDAFL